MKSFTTKVDAPWDLYFDGASCANIDHEGAPKGRAGVCLVFRTSRGEVMHYSFSLHKEECSNNEAEYEALIFGLLLALSMEVAKCGSISWFVGWLVAHACMYGQMAHSVCDRYGSQQVETGHVREETANIRLKTVHGRRKWVGKATGENG